MLTDKYLFFIGFGSITPSYQHDMLTTCSIDIYITNVHEDTMQESPCVFQCRLESIDNIELCISCGRTRDEIVNWRDFDQAQRNTVFQLSNQRLLGKLGKI